MPTQTKIIADSISPSGNRISTYIVTYPRFIHAELLTHRMFSRSSASARAIPIKRFIEMVEKNTVVPVRWGKNQSGMGATEEISHQYETAAQMIWMRAAHNAIESAQALMQLGVAKEITNRLIEPFIHITVLITATEFENFFRLRCHPAAQPEMQELAFNMRTDYENSTPKLLQPGEWHLPFADQYLDEDLTLEQKLKIVTARAARVSYLNFEGNIEHQKDYDLHDRLLADYHMSPFEMAAQCQDDNNFHGNFKGWKQYRKFVE